MTITVVICTWNREPALRETLRDLRGVHVPGSVACSTLVVDNGSDDETVSTARAEGGLGETRVVREYRPGLSRARNRALAECGESDSGTPHYLIWIDDDVSVPRGWIDAYVRAFRSHPTAVVFGGPVAPELIGEPPEWLPQIVAEVRPAWSAIDLGAEGPLGPGIDRLPYGANFAVRRDAVGDLIFDEELGRTHAGLGRGGEEIRFLQAVLRAGHTGWWVPGAGVVHRIGPDRQTMDYVRSYFEADGFDAEIREGHEASPMRRMGLLLSSLRASAAGAAARLVGRRRAAALRGLEVAGLRGRRAAARGQDLRP